jgi:hypothetical protein
VQIGDVMTEDEKREVLRQAWENVARLQEQFPHGAPREDILERRIPELKARCQLDKPLHETDSMRARRLRAEHDASWNAWFDARLEERLGDERDFMIEAVGTALGETVEDLKDEMDQRRKEERQALSDEVRKLRIELCELSTVVSGLRQVLAAERAKVLDLPPLPSARRMN